MTELEDNAEFYSTDAVARMAHVSYRQLDYWLRTGWITIGDDTPGSGFRRGFTHEQALAIVRLVARYTAARREIAKIRSGVAWREEFDAMQPT